MCPATAEYSRGIGVAVLKNTNSQSSLVLDSVQLLEADGVWLRDSYIMPLTDKIDVYGGGFQVPPINDDLSPEQLDLWKRRIPLAGATIPPLGSANMLLGVVDEPVGKRRVLGAQINYHFNGSYYRAISGVGAEFFPLGDESCAEPNPD
jgi:hypothetical protein